MHIYVCYQVFIIEILKSQVGLFIFWYEINSLTVSSKYVPVELVAFNCDQLTLGKIKSPVMQTWRTTSLYRLIVSMKEKEFLTLVLGGL